jgi:D-alanyl-D-alanine carboxypeptidase (penicillin-binding protein 5/6)
LDYGFSQIESVDLCRAKEPVGCLAVGGGIYLAVTVMAEREVNADLLRSDLPELRREINLNSSVEAPVRPGQKLGEAVFYLRGQELARVSLVAAEAVPRKGWVVYMREKVFG